MATRSELLNEIDALCDRIRDEAHRGWELDRLDAVARGLWKLLSPDPADPDDEDAA